MVKLAPHLVRPLPMVVPAFDGAQARPDDRHRPEHVRRDGGAVAARAPQAPARRISGGDSDWSPARHRMITGEEVVRAAAGAGAAQPHRRLPVLRLPDRRRPARADGARRRPSGSARSAPTASRSPGSTGDGARVTVLDRETQRLVRRSRADERGQRHRRLGGPDPARGAALRGRRAADRAQPRYPHHALARRPAAARRRDRPGRRRPLDLRAAVARTQPDRHHRQQLRGRARSRAAVDRRTSTTCSRRSTSSSAPSSAAAHLTGAYAGRAAADLERRQPQIGRHLPQGGAVRDLERADHDHRRQADDLAADGQAGRRPARRTRRSRRRPAAPTRSRSARRSIPSELPRVPGRRRATPTRSSPAATGTPPSGCSSLPPARAELAQPIVVGLAGPAGRGSVLGPPRAGAQRRRRAAAAHAAWPARRP